jgi:hypothetical protein
MKGVHGGDVVGELYDPNSISDIGGDSRNLPHHTSLSAFCRIIVVFDLEAPSRGELLVFIVSSDMLNLMFVSG